MNEQLRPILSELKQRLAEHYGERLESVVLYGSQARGDAAEDSDVDVLIVLNGRVDECDEILGTGGIMSELSLAHDVVLSGLWVSSVEYHARGNALWRNVHQEGVTL